MKIVIKNRNIRITLFDIICLCAVAFFSGSAMQTIVSFNTNVVVVLCLVVAISLKLIKHFIDTSLNCKEYFYIVSVLVILINTVCYPENIKYNLYIIFIISFAFYIAIHYSYIQVANAMVSFSFLTAIVAMLGTIILNTTSFWDVLPSFSNVNGYEYKIGILYNYIPVVRQRILGFFWESGLLASCMAYALILQITVLKVKNSRDFLRVVTFELCCFVSTSAAGYVIGLLGILLLLVDNKKASATKVLVSTLLIVVTLFLVFNSDKLIMNSGLHENEFVAKLLFQNLTENSRLISIQDNLRIWLQSPIWGSGFSRLQRLAIGVNDTSTSTYLMALYGVFACEYTLVYIYSVIRQKGMGGYSKAIFVFLVVFIINKEPHHVNMFSWVIMFQLMKNLELGGKVNEVKRII